MSDWRCLGPSQLLSSFLVVCQSGREAAAIARRAASTLDSMLAVNLALWTLAQLGQAVPASTYDVVLHAFLNFTCCTITVDAARHQ